MKNIIKIMFFLTAVFQINSVLADENITGIWQGKLVTAPGAEVTIQFIINQEANDSYFVTLNSPDVDWIKDVKANSVAYNSGVVKINVADLSGSFEGTVENGKIKGEWKEEGSTFPLNLTLLKLMLSPKDINRLSDTWHGKPTLSGRPKGEPNPTYVFRFEMSKQGEFTGVMEFPNQGIPEMPIAEMKIIDDDFTFKTQDMKFEMKLGDSEMAGSFKYLRVAGPNGSFRNVRTAQPDIPLTLKKGEYVAPVYKLSLPTEIMHQLSGEWMGPLWLVVLRFKMTKNGEFVGFYNPPLTMWPGTGMPITDVSMSDGKLTLKAENGDEFKGNISGNGIIGDLTGERGSEELRLMKRE